MIVKAHEFFNLAVVDRWSWAQVWARDHGLMDGLGQYPDTGGEDLFIN